MKITKKWLKEQSACGDGVEWFLTQKETDGLKVVKKLIKEKRLDWANWLIVRIMKYKQYVAYAIYAAEQVIDIFEKEYPDDKRPRTAIEAARKCLKNPTQKNKDAAYDAASDATSASFAAAYDAASDAADASDAASDAAYAAAASDAAYAAADAEKKMQLKILRYGFKLLKGRKV